MDDIDFCIDYLARQNEEDPDCFGQNKEEIWRGLMNITMPINLSDEFYCRQDKLLQAILSQKKVVEESAFKDGLNIFKGDITLLRVDAIVNACNSQMLGCFAPNHLCVDNAIHTFAGLQVRRDMMEIMRRQGREENSGECKVSKAYNLPSSYILHTVGPIYTGLRKDEIDLSSCYHSCLIEADRLGLKSVAFPSISTGVFGYPIRKACKTAIKTSKSFLENNAKSVKKIIFVLFSNADFAVYKKAMEEEL